MPRAVLAFLAVLLAVASFADAPWMARAESYRVSPYGAGSGNGGGATRYKAVAASATFFDSHRGRHVPVRIYYPAAASERFPVIVFSTGLGRSREDCAYLGHHWASCGYVSVHVQHPGSDEEARGGLRPRKELQRAFYAPANIRNRPMDISFVMDELERMQREGAEPSARFDLKRIGAAGHDFGAQTVLALAGQVLPGQLAFRDQRVRAVVAMSAPVPLGQVPLEVAYEHVTLPCLHITGTADNSIVATTKAPQRRLPFDYTSAADQYLVTFYGADHMSYSGHATSVFNNNRERDALYHRFFAETSAAFWDAYLKDDPSAKAWLNHSMSRYLSATARVEKKLVSEPSPTDSP